MADAPPAGERITGMVAHGAAVPDAPAPSRETGPWLAFVGLLFLFAMDMVAVRFVGRSLPSFWAAATRFLTAGTLFLLIVAARRLPLPQGRALAGSLLYGSLQFGVGSALSYVAVQEVPAGIAAVVLASIPLFTVLFAAVAGQEHLRAQSVVGALLGMAGIAILLGARAEDGIPLPYLLAAVGAAACFALGSVVLKGLGGLAPASVNAPGMLLGGATLLVLSLATGELAAGDLAAGTLPLPPDATTWAVQLYLMGPATLGTFLLLFYILKRWPASRVSFQAVLSPVVAILLALWLLDEPVTGNLFLGGALILVGVYVGALMPRRL